MNRLGAALIGLLSLLSCARRTEAVPAVDVAAAQSDTLRGVVELTGSLPRSQLILRWGAGPSDGAALSGRAAELLSGLTSLEVIVRGRWGQFSPEASPSRLRGFVVEQFLVRAGDGFPAHDGVVAFRDGKWVLVSTDGVQTATPFLPDALRQQQGVRVYLLGPLNKPPHAYGVVHAR